MKFGIRIPVDIFSDDLTEKSLMFLDAFGSLKNLTDFLKNNFDCVEIGMIYSKTNADIVKNCVEILKRNNLSVTFHGSLNDVHCAKDFFLPYEKTFSNNYQTKYNITVHPVHDMKKTTELLCKISDYAKETGKNVVITLENQRNKSEESSYMGCSGVLKTVNDINRDNVKICFDFGHQLSNTEKNTLPADIPSKDFFRLTAHTHIHSYCDGVTHFPINTGKTLLDENLTALLKYNYDGVLLLELCPDRFYTRFNVYDSMEKSVSIIKNAYRQVVKREDMINQYKNYSLILDEAEKVLFGCQDAMYTLGPAIYILNMGKTKIAVDPVTSIFPIDEKAKEKTVQLIKKCDAVILTHSHSDHFDESILNELSPSTTVFCPEFMKFNGKNVIYTKDKDVFDFKNIKISFFSSPHGKIIKQNGFKIFFKDKNYVFPTDVRDYSYNYGIKEQTDLLIAHLHLGAKNSLNTLENEYCDKFVSFVSGFNPKKIYISHLFDVHRSIYDMWSDLHYNIIKGKIKNCEMLKMGDYIQL